MTVMTPNKIAVVLAASPLRGKPPYPMGQVGEVVSPTLDARRALYQIFQNKSRKNIIDGNNTFHFSEFYLVFDINSGALRRIFTPGQV